MSTNSRLPEGDFTSPNEENKQESAHRSAQPEFTLIDERGGEKIYTHYTANGIQRTFHESYDSNGKGKQPHSLRFICLLGLIFCAIFAFGIFLWSLVMTVFSLVTLFQNPRINQGTRDFWVLFLNAAVAGFGFTIGLISPSIGLGLIALYFSLSKFSKDDDFIKKSFRRSFHQ